MNTGLLFKSKENIQIFRFVCIGILNTVFGYGFYAFLLFVGMHYAWAGLLATVAGVLFNFKTTGLYVFKSRNNKLFHKFVFVYVIVYCVSTMGIGALEMFRISPYYGGAIMILPSAIISYILNKKFVYGK